MQIRDQMRADLLAARKQRNGDDVAMLRALLAAIDHAEAVEVDEPDSSAPPVFGQLNEVPRRKLTEADIQAILQDEADELRAAIAEFEHADRPDKVAQLRSHLVLVERYLGA